MLLMASVNVFSQVRIDSVLAKIERNNTTLAALRENMEAEKIGNKTGLWPSNPEVEFNYLWGNPSAIGNRHDIAVSQSFDFPTAYIYRNQISELKNNQAGLEYERQRKDILHETRILLAGLIYNNALLAEYNMRVNHAERIAESYSKKLEAGEANILEFNRSQVYLLNMVKEAETIEIEREALLAELEKLNGGKPIAFSDSMFIQRQINSDFEHWYATAEQDNPVLKWVRQELAINHKQKQLQVAQSLPKFSAGYMSEKVVGEQFQGLTMGISIPLWENKNAVRYAKAKIAATEKIQTDAKLQFYNEMKTQYEKVAALQNSISGYESKLERYNSRDLLLKALDSGEISIGEYLIELALYYDSVDKLLEMKRSMNKAWFELLKFH